MSTVTGQFCSDTILSIITHLNKSNTNLNKSLTYFGAFVLLEWYTNISLIVKISERIRQMIVRIMWFHQNFGPKGFVSHRLEILNCTMTACASVFSKTTTVRHVLSKKSSIEYTCTLSKCLITLNYYILSFGWNTFLALATGEYYEALLHCISNRYFLICNN